VPTLAIVEVKARRATAQGAPIETLTWAQRRRIQRAAAAWLAAHPGGPSAWPSGQGSPGARGRTWGEIRFDLVGVHWPPGAPGPVLEAIWGLD
jgi:putative endonuclease